MDLNNANEFLQLLEDKLEEVKIWKSLLEKKDIVKKKKKTKALWRVNESIRELARGKLEVLEGAQSHKPQQYKPAGQIQAAKTDIESGSKDDKTPIEVKNTSQPKLKTTTKHRDRKKVKTTDKDYPFQDGQMAKLSSTQSLTSVNHKQAENFVSGDEVKIMRCYTNQYDDDVAEIIKDSRLGPIRALISLEDLHSQ